MATEYAYRIKFNGPDAPPAGGFSSSRPVGVGHTFDVETGGTRSSWRVLAVERRADLSGHPFERLICGPGRPVQQS